MRVNTFSSEANMEKARVQALNIKFNHKEID